MAFDIIIVAVVAGLAILLFSLERVPVDLTAIGIMITLVLCGVITPSEGLKGFTNQAVVTIAAMYVLSEGLIQTGGVRKTADFLKKLFEFNFSIAFLALLICVVLLSAFVNNTPVVAVFIPVILRVCTKAKVSASKLLMPVSFLAMLGGVCTLIGTSTNLLVNSIAIEEGLPGFSLFEFTILGAILTVVGLLYFFFGGMKLIPNRRALDSDLKKYSHRYLTAARVTKDSKLIGEQIMNIEFLNETQTEIVTLFRQDEVIREPKTTLKIEAGDTLCLSLNLEGIQAVKDREGLELVGEVSFDPGMADEEKEAWTTVELVLSPTSSLIGKKISDSGLYAEFQAVVLAIRHREHLQPRIMSHSLQGGDSLLIELPRKSLARLKQQQDFIFIDDVGEEEFRFKRLPLAIGVIIGVVSLAAAGVLSIMTAALTGAFILVASGTVRSQEAYKAIDWKVIFLLAGTLALGVAMSKTGAASLLVDFLLESTGKQSPLIVLGAFYLITLILTSLISNASAAILIAPIAISTAAKIDVSVAPFLVAITFAASSSFLTPVGYQTNTMIYQAGRYRFWDFLIVGGPLNAVLLIVSVFLIPKIWPL